jgi:hypothetical protein
MNRKHQKESKDVKSLLPLVEGQLAGKSTAGAEAFTPGLTKLRASLPCFMGQSRATL